MKHTVRPKVFPLSLTIFDKIIRNGRKAQELLRYAYISYFVRFEDFTAVTMKSVVFWDVALCRLCVNRRFGGTYRLHLQDRRIREQGTSVSRWLQTEPPVGNNQLYKNRERESRPQGKLTERRGVGSVVKFIPAQTTYPNPLLSVDFPCGLLSFSPCSYVM
jgi:hypothetical protein